MNLFLKLNLLCYCDITKYESIPKTNLVLLFVELVDDDTDQEVEGEEGSGHDEENKEEVGVDGVLSIRLNVHLDRQIDRLEGRK